MITWRRAEWDHLCGKCKHQIPAGGAIQVTTIAGLTRQFLRGECCAGPAPAGLAPFVPKPAFAPMVHLNTAAGTLPLGFKREPGEEG